MLFELPGHHGRIPLVIFGALNWRVAEILQDTVVGVAAAVADLCRPLLCQYYPLDTFRIPTIPADTLQRWTSMSERCEDLACDEQANKQTNPTAELTSGHTSSLRISVGPLRRMGGLPNIVGILNSYNRGERTT